MALPFDAEDGSGTAQSQIYAALRDDLMSGRFLPGERLVARDLAERFDTSAMPVREALHRLVSEDALTDLPNRGVVVPQATLDAVTDVVRIRCLVEGTATEWGAAVLTGADLAGLHRLNAEMEAGIDQGLTESYLTLNRRFHFAIYRAARSPALMQVIERLWMRAGPWLNVMREEETIRFGFDHHRAILAALRAGDGEGARRAVVLDIADASEVILRRLADRATDARGRSA